MIAIIVKAPWSKAQTCVERRGGNLGQWTANQMSRFSEPSNDPVPPMNAHDLYWFHPLTPDSQGLPQAAGPTGDWTSVVFPTELMRKQIQMGLMEKYSVKMMFPEDLKFPFPTDT